jgi:hypothetical protein
MSRKVRRQLREAITSISHPYSRPASRTRRAEDIITPEGSPQSTPRSTTAELPMIHEPTPVRFAGVVEPSPTRSPPERDIRTDLPTLASPSTSKGKAPFEPFHIKLCTTNDHPRHPLIFWAVKGQEVRGYTILWTGHHIYSKPEGGEQFAVYPLQHSQVHKDVWYEVAWDDKNAEFFAFADATVRFPEITLAKRKESPEGGDDTTKFTGDLTTALREAAAQVLPDP